MELFFVVTVLLGILLAFIGLFVIIEEGHPGGLLVGAIGAILFFGTMSTSDSVDDLKAQARQVPVMEQTIKEQKKALEESKAIQDVLKVKAQKADALMGKVEGLEGALARTKNDLRESQVAKGLLEGKLSAANNNLNTCQIDQGEALLERDIIKAKLERVTKLVGGAL